MDCLADRGDLAVCFYTHWVLIKHGAARISLIAWLTMHVVVLRAAEVYKSASPIPPCPHGALGRMDRALLAGRYNVGAPVRPLPAFLKDKDATSSAEAGECNKSYPSGRHCTVVLGMCMTHAIVLGYHFSPAEGRRDVLAVIYRFWQDLPFRVFYDYACG